MHALNRLTFRQLRALRAVTEARSISLAAEALGLTAPAVHSQIGKLEESLGWPMLYRQGPEAFSPTAEGVELLAAFGKVEAELTIALARMEAIRRGLAGTVVLGVVSTAKYFAPSLVAALKQALPDVDVTLRVGNRSSIIGALRSHALDLVIMGRPPADPPVIATPIGDNPHLLLVAADHPFAGRANITAAEILHEPFIAREQGSGTRILSDRFLYGFDSGEPAELIEMPSNETIKQAVIAGLGIAILSRHTVTEELRTGRLIAVQAPGLPVVRKWFVLHAADKPPLGAARTVHDRIPTLIAPIFRRNLAPVPAA